MCANLTTRTLSVAGFFHTGMTRLIYIGCAENRDYNTCFYYWLPFFGSQDGVMKFCAFTVQAVFKICVVQMLFGRKMLGGFHSVFMSVTWKDFISSENAKIQSEIRQHHEYHVHALCTNITFMLINQQCTLKFCNILPNRLFTQINTFTAGY
jgi:hypothetical protein